MGARAVQAAKRNLDRLLAAAQLGITMASLAIGWLGEPTIGHLLEQALGHAPGGHIIAVAIAFTIITALHIVIGEQAPKLAALQYSERTSLLVAQPLSLFNLVLKPFIAVLDWASRMTMRLLGLRGEPGHGGIYTREELTMLVEASGKAGVLDESEREIIDRAFDFAEYSARELMVPRTEVAAVSAEMTGPELLHKVVEDGFSRYPVYEGSIDQVLGLVHIKDVIAAMERAGEGEFASIRARDLARPSLTIPETLPADELLDRLRASNARMALVIDEFGGMAGVVTMENLLERLVGSLRDEFERPSPADVIHNPDGSVSLNGLTLIHEANELLGLEIESSEDDTIGGYIFTRIGHLPEVGDAVEVNGHRLQVEAMDERRIDRVLVTPRGTQAEPGGEA
jgi:CBS domain containing-hemolysin-like protein